MIENFSSKMRSVIKLIYVAEKQARPITTTELIKQSGQNFSFDELSHIIIYLKDANIIQDSWETYNYMTEPCFRIGGNFTEFAYNIIMKQASAS